MKKFLALTVSMALCAALVTTVAANPIDSMRWHRRILLVAAPDLRDPKAALQRHILAEWERQAADRDLSLVEVSGSHVSGTSDSAALLRQRYQISADSFEVLLIGKDGHVALRSVHPLSAEMLQDTIDAMPMRRAGER